MNPKKELLWGLWVRFKISFSRVIPKSRRQERVASRSLVFANCVVPRSIQENANKICELGCKDVEHPVLSGQQENVSNLSVVRRFTDWHFHAAGVLLGSLHG